MNVSQLELIKDKITCNELLSNQNNIFFLFYLKASWHVKFKYILGSGTEIIVQLKKMRTPERARR